MDGWTAELCFSKTEENMNFLLNDFTACNLSPFLVLTCPFTSCSVINVLTRILAIVLPCRLIFLAFVFGNEYTELLNCGSLPEEFALDELNLIRPIMGSMLPGKVNHSQSGSEGGSQLCTSCPMFFEFFKASGEPICGECPDNSANDCKSSTNDCKRVGIYFHGTVPQFFGTLVIGFIVTLIRILALNGKYAGR